MREETAAFHITLAHKDLSATILTHTLPDLPDGWYGFHITFDAGRYPWQQHFCYMRSLASADQDGSAPRRFAQMSFSATPPGIAVGPWPGWRGIPDMPKVSLTIGKHTSHGRYNFWGDEPARQRCRVIVFIPIAGEREFQLTWSDSRLVPIEIEILPSQSKQAVPQSVRFKPELQHAHPRLLFSAKEIVQLRRRSCSTHGKLWQEIETLLANWNLPFSITSESKLPEGTERLHDMDRVILAGFHSLITEKADDRERVKSAFFNFLAKALNPGFEPMQIDTQSGECLFTLCLGYDWLHEQMSADERLQARDQLFKAAELVWRHLGYERTDYAQAHFLGCSHGLLAFSFLFWQMHPQAKAWAEYLRGAFNIALNMLPDDGFYPHGINLWIYEHAFLLRYLELFRHCTEEDLWLKTAYWKNSSQFRQASLSPDGLYAITFGDPQYRVSGDAWMHYLIARRTGSGTAQAIGNRLVDLPVQGVDFRNAPGRRRVWEYLYYDPQVAETVTENQINDFDGGQIFFRARNGQDTTMLTFRAGPSLGYHRYAAGEWSGYGHSDPCNGSFMLMRNCSFLVCGPGPVYRRDTALHNTLTFDGQGQIGDTLPWAAEFIPQNRWARITARQLAESPMWIEADLAPAYLAHLGVEQLRRRLYFIAADVFLIHDQIRLDREREIQWNLHTYGRIDLETAMPNAIRIQDKEETLRVISLLPDHISYRTGWSEFVPAYPHDGQRDRFLQLYCRGKNKTFLVLMILGERQMDVQWQKPSDAQSVLQIDGKNILINLNASS